MRPSRLLFVLGPEGYPSNGGIAPQCLPDKVLDAGLVLCIQGPAQRIAGLAPHVQQCQQVLQCSGHDGARMEGDGVQHGIRKQHDLDGHDGPIFVWPLAEDGRLVVGDVLLPEIRGKTPQNGLPERVPREGDYAPQALLELCKALGLIVAKFDVQVNLVKDDGHQPLDIIAGQCCQACQALPERAAQPCRVPARGPIAGVYGTLRPIQHLRQVGTHRGVVAVVETKQNSARLRPHVVTQNLHAHLIGTLHCAQLDLESQTLEHALHGPIAVVSARVWARPNANKWICGVSELTVPLRHGDRIPLTSNEKPQLWQGVVPERELCPMDLNVANPYDV
mmetsp:Transcript_78969/g.218564  ORF Transcript_78969/g.218564 Transcript_78969/m.218564 type:complete len:335 (+) Transcript_78969:492-1496(+)